MHILGFVIVVSWNVNKLHNKIVADNIDSTVSHGMKNKSNGIMEKKLFY